MYGRGVVKKLGGKVNFHISYCVKRGRPGEACARECVPGGAKGRKLRGTPEIQRGVGPSLNQPLQPIWGQRGEGNLEKKREFVERSGHKKKTAG